MNKPSTVAYREFVDAIQRVVNECELPAFVIISVLQNLMNQLVMIDEQQYRHDSAKYLQEEKGDADNG